jgi:hypothetical protein
MDVEPMRFSRTHENESRIETSTVFLVKILVVLVRELHVEVPKCVLVAYGGLRFKGFDCPVKPRIRSVQFQK